jgi:hypothetical protein
MERGEGHELMDPTLAEFAGFGRRVRDPLKKFERFAAFIAAILINRHG